MQEQKRTGKEASRKQQGVCALTQRHTTLTVKDLGGGLRARDPLDLDQHPCPQK